MTFYNYIFTKFNRYGPRSCFAIPDLSAVTIQPQQFARFVLASDGLWDVMSIHEVEHDIWKFKDIHFMAEYLSNKASDKRMRRGMRPDDITVIIVDINPDYFMPQNFCCSCLLS